MGKRDIRITTTSESGTSQIGEFEVRCPSKRSCVGRDTQPQNSIYCSGELQQHRDEKTQLESSFESTKSQQSEERAKLEGMAAILQQYKDEKMKLEKEYQEEKAKWANNMEKSEKEYQVRIGQIILGRYGIRPTTKTRAYF